MSDSNTLHELVLFVLFGTGENFKYLTLEEIHTAITARSWIDNVEIKSLEYVLNDGSCYINKDHTYSLTDYGIKCALKVNFY